MQISQYEGNQELTGEQDPRHLQYHVQCNALQWKSLISSQYKLTSQLNEVILQR